MKKKKGKRGVSTFQGSDASIEGNVEFEGTIRLDGGVRGKISSANGTVVIGEKAVINADVSVDVAIIMGDVNGVVDAKKRIELYPPGRIVGDIRAPVICIQAGAVFQGNCTMQSKENLFDNNMVNNKKN
jgi:cytoskeletal protein CcmA (bactofilin family)